METKQEKQAKEDVIAYRKGCKAAGPGFPITS